MPRSRGSELPQRQLPRVPLHLKTSASSEANTVLRPSVDRSPKIDDRRSPHSPHHEKKRGTRVADLETKLAQTQEELKKLKEQLASAEAAKRNAQQELEETKKQIPVVAVSSPKKTEQDGVLTSQEATSHEKADDAPEHLPIEDSINSAATDVFEVVPPALLPPEPLPLSADEVESNKVEEDEDTVEKEEVETKTVVEEEKDGKKEEFSKNMEVSNLNFELAEKKEIDALLEENASLKKQVEEAEETASALRANKEEIGLKLVALEEELREHKAREKKLEDEVETTERAKALVEAEMKRLRVQTEQWRKAAEEAAAVLASEEEGTGRKMSERCGSMDKQLGGYGGGGFIGSPVLGGEVEDGFREGKRKGGSGGIRMFGELWKKKPLK